jgi:hypothetical protein
MDKLLEQQNQYLARCMLQMTDVLKNCNAKRESCSCSIQVKYIDDSELPESARYKMSIVCAKKGEDFYQKTVANLEQVNNDIDVLKK